MTAAALDIDVKTLARLLAGEEVPSAVSEISVPRYADHVVTAKQDAKVLELGPPLYAECVAQWPTDGGPTGRATANTVRPDTARSAATSGPCRAMIGWVIRSPPVHCRRTRYRRGRCRAART